MYVERATTLALLGSLKSLAVPVLSHSQGLKVGAYILFTEVNPNTIPFLPAVELLMYLAPQSGLACVSQVAHGRISFKIGGLVGPRVISMTIGVVF